VGLGDAAHPRLDHRAGTAEIHRNTIAEQVLKLPHDPAMPAR
jgi:hypothetical protein